MIVMIKLYTIVMCHCIGDYVLQNDFLAKTKGGKIKKCKSKTSSNPCAGWR